MNASSLTHSIAVVRSRMVHACERARRDPTSVNLLLASKTVEPERIREAYQAGVKLFGENRAQELVEKLPLLRDLAIEWHFIGNLQTNKVKAILPHVSLIHSLDRLSLADEIEKQAEQLGIQVRVLVEINSSGEPSKGGLDPAQVPSFLNSLKSYPHLRIEGVMTLAKEGNEKEIRKCFKKTADVFRENRGLFHGSILSMGMSGDFELAIEEGSTLVRVGSGVFGSRPR